jgi:hypothetical protein
MSERNPFEQRPGVSSGFYKGPLSCERWEDLLTDALDGSLPATDRTAFDEHSSGCKSCARLLTESSQGLEWLRFLEPEPEVPSDLIERILSKTSGSASIAVAAGAPALAGAGGVPVHLLGVPVRRVMWDSRMLMTVAMAFFSIALTLNLAGVRFTNLKLSDLTPASLEMGLTQQFYSTKKSMVQYYDNLRLVVEVESKVREMQRTEEMRQAEPQTQQSVPANPGDGKKNGGRLNPETEPGAGRKPPARAPLDGLLWGTPELASETPGRQSRKTVETENEEAEVEIAVLCRQVRAERSLA